MHDNAKRLVEKKLQQLYNSIYPKFVFVPRKAYSDSDSSVDGLVIDLQDIVQMDIDIKEDILEYKYDFSTYSGNYKKEIEHQGRYGKFLLNCFEKIYYMRNLLYCDLSDGMLFDNMQCSRLYYPHRS